MTVYHIVLFKLTPSTPPQSPLVSEFTTKAKAMVGQIPGLQSISIGPPHHSTAHRAQGFDMGLVAVLDGPGDIAVYAGHKAHLKVSKLREEICTDTLAYDLEF